MIEDVVDEIQALLLLKLPAELEAAELDPVRRFLIAEEDIPPTELPAIFILAQSTREIPIFSKHDEIHDLFIITLQQHIDTQVLARQLFGYKAALRHVLTQNLPQNGFVTKVAVLRHDYAPIQQIENGTAFSKSVQIEIEATERVEEI